MFIIIVLLIELGMVEWTQKFHRETIGTNGPSMCLVVEKLEDKSQHKQSQGPGGKHLDEAIVPGILKHVKQNGGFVQVHV